MFFNHDNSYLEVLFQSQVFPLAYTWAATALATSSVGQQVPALDPIACGCINKSPGVWVPPSNTLLTVDSVSAEKYTGESSSYEAEMARWMDFLVFWKFNE